MCNPIMSLSLHSHNQMLSGTFFPLALCSACIPLGIQTISSLGFAQEKRFTGKHREQRGLLTLEGEGKRAATTHSPICLKDISPWPPRDHLPPFRPLPATAPARSTSSLLHLIPTHTSKNLLPCTISEQAYGHCLILNIPTSPFLPHQNISSACMTEGTARNGFW